jgi:hypothetical protein
VGLEGPAVRHEREGVAWTATPGGKEGQPVVREGGSSGQQTREGGSGRRQVLRLEEEDDPVSLVGGTHSSGSLGQNIGGNFSVHHGKNRLHGCQPSKTTL